MSWRRMFEFIAQQRGDPTVVRISDGESGLSARTIARRLSSISGFYAYLVARGDTAVTANPVPRGLSTRRRGGRRQRVPLVRVPRTLPRILSPGEVTDLLGALRTDRDRAMVCAMVLGGLRRCEVLGLALGDVQVPERSLFIAEGKGGHQRVVPISNTFFAEPRPDRADVPQLDRIRRRLCLQPAHRRRCPRGRCRHRRSWSGHPLSPGHELRHPRCSGLMNSG